MSRTLLVSTTQRGAYPTISDALAAAPDDGAIAIAPGEYVESLELAGGRVSLFAGEGEGSVTISPSAPHRPVLDIRRAGVALFGLTLKAGDAPAVTVTDGKLRMGSCVLSTRFGIAVDVGARSEFDISGCKVDGAQLGFQFVDCRGTVAECEILNVVEDGVVVRYADPVIRNCTINGCGQRGIYVYEYSRPTIEGCDISRTGADGIAVGQQSAPVIRRSRIHDTRGVAISFAAGCNGSVEATATENTAAPAIDVAPGAGPTVELAGANVPATAGAGASDGVHAPDARRVEELLAQLDGMVGLAVVKEQVRTVIDEIQVNEWRRSAGLSVGAVSHHLIFAGAPGTGKTTVARIYGQLLAELGALPKGNFLEVARRDLVGMFLGETTKKTHEAFERAMGGVLFIDEAYTLSRTFGAGGDFGQEAIDAIVKLMEDHRHEIAVIAAGYTAEMREFLDANPGLASRFTKTIEFENYNSEELVRIVGHIAKGDDYLLAPGAGEAVRAHFDGVVRDQNFGNGREARKLVEGMRRAQAQRLRQLGRVPSAEELQTLIPEDVAVASGRA